MCVALCFKVKKMIGENKLKLEKWSKQKRLVNRSLVSIKRKL